MSKAQVQAMVDRGVALSAAGRHEEALVEFRAAAAAGHTAAIANIGIAYEWGEGVAKDRAEAYKWSKRAAEAGNSISMFNHAVHVRFGVPEAGVAPDRAEGMRQMRWTADVCGDPDAMFHVGAWLGQDNKDDPEQLVWLRRAVEKGSKEATNSMGVCYAHGMGGLEVDPEIAASWYRKGADQGHATAMRNLGTFYSLGIGVEKNLATAAMWLERAIKGGCAEALVVLEAVKIDQARTKQTSSSSSSSTAIVMSLCSACGKLATDRCSGCMEKFYCSHECQLAQWKEHKAACKAKQAKLKEQKK